MARRLPGVRQRMEDAALELFERQGFAATTAAQIAAAAGTTERTFFRHFRDKVDAVFGDEARLLELAVAAVSSASTATPPWRAVRAGVLAVAAEFDRRRPEMSRRSMVVGADAALRERELARGVEWTAALTDALVARGTDRDLATLCSASGLTLFRVALERWAADPGDSVVARTTAAFRDLGHEVGRRPTARS